MSDLELTGCTPDPLMSYLKSLGVLRILSEQFDSTIRAAWTNGIFVLSGRHLQQEAVSEFFLERYSPTPVLAPWAGGSGFFGSDNRAAVEALVTSELNRIRPYKTAIELVRRILAAERLAEKPADEIKERLLRRYRREMPDDFIAWMDAALVIQTEGQAFPPILGTGGNDGRLDFTQNFMQRVVALGLHAPTMAKGTASLLQNALMGIPASGLSTAAVGQFSPGRAGGPNAAQGLSGSPTDNPWDFILMIEGTLLLSGSVSRRMGASQHDRAIFPFTVRANPVGFTSSSESESADARGEIWLPLWDRPTSLSEVRAVFAEGRAELSGHQSKDGVDFARAIAGLGVDRGIQSFVRFGFLKRSGKAFLAPALGQFDVPHNPARAALLHDIDPWLDRLRIACKEDTAPARFKSALRRIDTAVFDYCRYADQGGGEQRFSLIVRALGNAERELANGERFRSNERRTLRPLTGLRPEWMGAADDGSAEFELAMSLAAATDPAGKLGPIRANLEPFDWSKRGAPGWAERGGGVVWKGGDLSLNLADVLARRLIDATRLGTGKLPVRNEIAAAGLGAVAAFLAGTVDEEKIEELLWGLMAVDFSKVRPGSANGSTDAPIPRAYALLKLLFLPFSLPRGGDFVSVQTESEVLPLLRRGDGGVAGACAIAMRRLRASGFLPLPHRQAGRGNRDSDWSDATAGTSAARLAASLLFPISSHDATKLLKMVTREPKADDLGQLNQPQPEGAILE